MEAKLLTIFKEIIFYFLFIIKFKQSDFKLQIF